MSIIDDEFELDDSSCYICNHAFRGKVNKITTKQGAVCIVCFDSEDYLAERPLEWKTILITRAVWNMTYLKPGGMKDGNQMGIENH